ncbi:MAG: PEP/pyruvate-binding domain-containing protein [Chloroflexota bacterium]
MTDYTMALADPRARHLRLVGGKGVSLTRMVAAGLPVPAGFHITTEGYRRFIEANGLQEEIVRAATGASADDPASLELATSAIRALFDSATMPEEVSAAVRRAYDELGGSDFPVAVRSSATAEDLPGLSFAGQYDTLLNVRGEDALLAAVRQCWMSLWTARAIGYRLRNRVQQGTVAMAVVIQAMIPAQVSGVLFTANPTSGERDELVINASYGLGEAVVSGSVTPDSYTMEKASLSLKEMVLGTKEIAIVAAGGQGTTRHSISQDQQRQQALSPKVLRELAEMALKAEQVSGGEPQDLEWAVAEGRCWLLQSRPMTGLLPAPWRDVRWEPPVRGSIWLRRQVAENMPEPLSPLFEELYVRDGLERSVDRVWALAQWPGNPQDVYSRPMFATVNGYAYSRGAVRKSWVAVRTILQIFATGYIPIFRRGISLWTEDFLPPYLATVERWQTVNPEATPDEQLLAGIRELAREEALHWYGTTIALALAKASDVILEAFLTTVVRRAGVTSAHFLRGFPTKALEAESELETIAEKIRDSDELRALVETTPAERLLKAFETSPAARPVLDLLQIYLGRYGHLVYNLDFAEPTQAEAPLPVLMSLKASVERPGKGALNLQAEMAAERDRLVETTLRSLDPMRSRPFQSLLRWAQRLTPYREESLFYLGSAWPPLRRLALELGRRLVEAGSLSKFDDVFFLESAELAEAIRARGVGQSRPDLVRLARERCELREARKRLHPPAAVPPGSGLKIGPISLSGLETQKRNVGVGPILRGFAVSPGRVTAPASVLLSPTDFGKMAPRSILVCPTTTPAWTPLFALASGLVTDIGGVAAHGSIVAREYGIPAVMGTGNGTQRIADGQLVTVDGDAGTVVLANGSAADADITTASRLEEKGKLGQRLKLVAVALAALALWRTWQNRGSRRGQER